MANLKEVLSQLGVRLHKYKCEFMVPAVKYLGHIIDGKGLHPTADKLKAVREVPTLQNVMELKAYYLITVKYDYNLSTTLSVMAQQY